MPDPTTQTPGLQWIYNHTRASGLQTSLAGCTPLRPQLTACTALPFSDKADGCFAQRPTSPTRQTQWALRLCVAPPDFLPVYCSVLLRNPEAAQQPFNFTHIYWKSTMTQSLCPGVGMGHKKRQESTAMRETTESLQVEGSARSSPPTERASPWCLVTPQSHGQPRELPHSLPSPPHCDLRKLHVPSYLPFLVKFTKCL